MRKCVIDNPLYISIQGYLDNIRTYVSSGYETVFIGRPSKWGNPYTVKEFGREAAIAKFEEHLINSTLIDQIDELRYKVILCFCVPLMCHGHILLKYLYYT